MSAPQTQNRWVLKGKGGFDKLELEEDVPVPKVGDNEVLVKIKAVSLNFRDVIIVKDRYPFPCKTPLTPLSDGAGEVVAVGSKVSRFTTGDRVMGCFTQGQIGDVQLPDYASALGGAIDGVAAQYVVLNEQGLVKAPSNLDFVQAASLPCAALTAWNALYGLVGRQLGPGQWVMTQGTGGVSLFALQFAKAAGARVVATTSSPAKAEFLKSLGADHVIDYKTTPAYAKAAREFTGGKGFHHIVEIGGPGTLKQSVEAVAPEGVISVIGFVAESDQGMPTMLDALMHTCIVRGIWIGGRKLFEDMVAAIEATGIEPVIDEKVFGFGELREAYEHLEGQRHVGKVCVRFD